MRFTDAFIQRPVLASVISLLILVVGLRAIGSLEVRQYPATQDTVVTVSTSYRGANTDVIESQITEPLEESINGIDGIRTLTSVSREGGSPACLPQLHQQRRQESPHLLNPGLLRRPVDLHYPVLASPGEFPCL